MLSEEIRQNWKTDIIGHAQEIPSLKHTDYPAWTVCFPDKYGVAIPYDGADDINENFASANIYSSYISINNFPARRVLILCTEAPAIETPFAALCAELIDPGEDGAQRNSITGSPVQWWKEWKELLGNRSFDDKIYDVLGELCVLKKLVEMGADASWNGPDGASYDIETDTMFAEVKSTVVRDKREISISNQFQLYPPNKPLFLFLCQFEPSVQTGVSINITVSELEKLGYNTISLNEKLTRIGFEEGMSARNRRFLLHEMLKYTVDDSFPRITPASFVGGVLPTGITKITYTVDLSARTPESMV